jgi:hypothetical protein
VHARCQDIRSSLLPDVLAARAECAPLANATSVVCTGPTESRATACKAGFYRSEADTCQGVWLEVPCSADTDPSLVHSCGSPSCLTQCARRFPMPWRSHAPVGRTALQWLVALASTSTQAHVQVRAWRTISPVRVQSAWPQVTLFVFSLPLALITSVPYHACADCPAVNNATAVVCSNGTNSSAIACEAGFYVFTDGSCAGMRMIHRSSPSRHACFFCRGSGTFLSQLGHTRQNIATHVAPSACRTCCCQKLVIDDTQRAPVSPTRSACDARSQPTATRPPAWLGTMCRMAPASVCAEAAPPQEDRDAVRVIQNFLCTCQ